MRLRDALGISARRQRQLTWTLEAVLVFILVVGLMEADLAIVINAAVGLAVTRLPSILRRDYNIPMDAGLTLWITAAVVFHAAGDVPLPGSGLSAYQSVWWYDHLTHALSASVVAAAGYATARALDEHSDAVSFPPRFMAIYLLVFVLAFGVAWEIIEFAASGLASVAGVSVLTQYGLSDTMLDLVFDSAGALIVAVWGTAHLTGVVDALSGRLDARRNDPSD